MISSLNSRANRKVGRIVLPIRPADKSFLPSFLPVEPTLRSGTRGSFSQKKLYGLCLLQIVGDSVIR